MKIQSIQVKIISLILVVLLIGLSFSISFALSNQEKNLLEASQQTLSINTRVLNHTISNIMLSGEAPLANQTMEDLRSMPEFLEYEIYRRDGSRAFSDYETLKFVNNFQNKIMFNETPRTDKSMIDDEGFHKVLKSSTPLVILDEKTQEMEYFFPILNYADCRVCHGDDHFIRGVAHFRISLSDIYSKISSARQILFFFFLGIGIFIFMGILFLLRQMIIKPVLQIGSVVSMVGGGNLDVGIQLKQRDELGNLATRINQMIDGLKKSKELELENTRIEASLKESRKYLDNINEGLLLLDRELKITSEYSTYLLDLFEKDNIKGLSLEDFIYGETHPSKEESEELHSFLNILFNNQTASMSMIMDINPLDMKESILPSGKKVIFNAQFQRIIEEGEVLNLMVLFQDMTDIVKTREALEIEKQTRESELEQIAAILKLGPKVFEDFLKSANEILLFIEENREELTDRKIVNKAFRDTHSLKGSARYLKFNIMEQYAHKLEDYFAAIRDKQGSLDNEFEEKLGNSLEGIRKELVSIDRIIERFRQFSIGNTSDQPEMDIFKLRLTDMIDEISIELGKNVQLDFQSDWNVIPGLERLQSSVFHLIKNALDHGIEDSFERLSLDKPEKSLLSVSFTRENDFMILEVKDDGRGLDFKKIETIAMEKGLLKPGEHFHSQILRTMFMPGFSSRNNVTSISGRGVGLDAVKEDVSALKGKINVKTSLGNGTAFILTIPLNQLELEV